MSNILPFTGPRQPHAVLSEAMSENLRGGVLVLGYLPDGTLFADTNIRDDGIFRLLADAHATISAALAAKHQQEHG